MATETLEPPTKPAKPAETINVKGMSERWKAAQAAGGIPKSPPPEEPSKPAEPAKTAEPTKPAETPAQPPEVKKEEGIPAPPKPEAKKPEPTKAPEQPAKIPAQNFKELEASRDEFRKKAEAAEARAKEIEAKLATAVNPKQIEELQAKLDATNKKAEEYETIVQRFYVEHSPQFKKAYDEKIGQIVEQAKDAVGAELAGEIEETFEMRPGKARDERLEEVVGEISQFKQTAVAGAYAELKRTQRERDAELAKSKENYGKLKEYEEEQAKTRSTEFSKAVKQTFAEEMEAFSAIPAFAMQEGNDAQNAIAKANRAKAEEFLASDPMHPKNRARLALWAAHGVHAVGMVQAQNEMIAKLQGQIAEMQLANPSVRGGARTGDNTGDKPKSAAEKYREAMEKGIPAKP